MGDESRGASPGRSLGRRGSYKTSRGEHLHSLECFRLTTPSIVRQSNRWLLYLFCYLELAVRLEVFKQNIQFYLYIVKIQFFFTSNHLVHQLQVKNCVKKTNGYKFNGTLSWNKMETHLNMIYGPILFTVVFAFCVCQLKTHTMK